MTAPTTRRSQPQFGATAGLMALVAGATAMGLSPVFVRLADVGPFTSAFWRVGLSLPLLWAWMRYAERGDRTGARPVRFAKATLLAGLTFAGDLFFWHLAIAHTSVANATFFATLAPLWVVVFGWLLFGERVSRAVLAGLALCLLGGAALVSGSLSAAPDHVLGDLFGVATGIFFGLFFLAVRAARLQASAARVTFEMTAVTAAILGLIAVAFESELLPRSWKGWEAVVALALVSHTGGQGLLSVALGVLPAVFSSLVIFLEALIAALTAWMVLGEAVTWVQGIGALLIVAGIAIARPR